MEFLKLRTLVALFACLAIVFGYMWMRNSYWSEARLVGEWHYSYHDFFYPKYASDLSIYSDGTYFKREEYTEYKGAPTAVSTFKGPYTINSNGIPPGMIAFHFYNDSVSKIDGKTVVTGPQGGFTYLCHFAFDESGNLLIMPVVEGIRGTRKNPADLKAGGLVPSWDAYSPAESAPTADSPR